MFHSSSFRHEQYRIRSASGSKHTLHKKLPSLDSKISADTDSECSSSSSSPTYSTVSSPISTASFSANTISTAPTSIIQEQKRRPSNPRRKKRTQPSRSPDLVYSCPRPLAFPFHNDDHFLPIAEADPRDVARVAPPSVNRAHSIQSKDSINTESSFSRHSSILSSIQQGTVSTIRSFFQLPSSLSSLSQFTQPDTKYQPSERLEIKQGTVQSLKDFFTRQETGPTPKKGKPIKTASQLETNSPPKENESLMSRASEFASRAIWGTPEEPRKSFASEIKKFSARVISNLIGPEKDTKQDTKEPSKVGKLWNSFKSFMSSKKSSKVGPISI